ncbi:MAG: hypothetical protein MZV49_07525 [Rhodopseudomonas palustris]|nr:hypothetical protein [Rhodopseudomonas palustris]
MLARRTLWLAAAVAGLSCCVSLARADQAQINTLNELFGALQRCWQAPRCRAAPPGCRSR